MIGRGEKLIPAHDKPLPVFHGTDLKRTVTALQKAAGSQRGSLSEGEQRDVAALPLLPGKILEIDMGDGHVVRSVIVAPPQHRDQKITDITDPEVDKKLDPGDDLEITVEFQQGSRSNYRLWALGIVQVRGKRSSNTTTIYQKS